MCSVVLVIGVRSRNGMFVALGSPNRSISLECHELHVSAVEKFQVEFLAQRTRSLHVLTTKEKITDGRTKYCARD